MNWRGFLAQIWANRIAKQTQKWVSKPIETQEKTLQNLLKQAQNTAFGQDHGFNKINNYESFKKNVPIKDYEALKPYIERTLAGESNVLWQGKPLYFAKTSGTTSGIKYIPISKQSISNHINSARNALLTYIFNSKKADFLGGKLMFLSGSPILELKNGIRVGRLSGIVNHHVPLYLRRNQCPDFETNCIDDWEQKVDAIVNQTIGEDLRLVSGIPPWVQMYFEKLTKKTGKSIKDIFPNLGLFVYGGVNFEPYRQKLEQCIGKTIDSIELFPASEGFFAYQNTLKNDGLLLLLNEGIFYEFMPVETFFDPNPTRICLKDVILNQNYVLIINSNAGLWGYNIGDTIKFVSLNPYKIKVTGRLKHFISAFGEHVIGEEVERAMLDTAQYFGLQITEFHVAPQINPNPTQGLPFHEWFVEFEVQNKDLEAIEAFLDAQMCQQNTYYKDLVEGKIIQGIKIKVLKKGAFVEYMKAIGKLGGQNKVPRLANDRTIADKLNAFAQ